MLASTAETPGSGGTPPQVKESASVGSSIRVFEQFGDPWKILLHVAVPEKEGLRPRASTLVEEDPVIRPECFGSFAPIPVRKRALNKAEPGIRRGANHSGPNEDTGASGQDKCKSQQGNR